METFGAALLERAAGASNRIWFRLVTPGKDDFGTNILPEGVDLTRHKKNPVFLWMHRSAPSGKSPQTPEPHHVIGRVVDYDQSEQALDILVEFDDKDDFARLCLRKVQDGFLRAVSIGFDPTKVTKERVEDPIQAAIWKVKIGDEATVIRQCLLEEASLVIIGANEDALKLTRMAAERAERTAAPIEERAAVISMPKGRAVEHTAYGVTYDSWNETAEVKAWRAACGDNAECSSWATVDHAKYERLFAFVADEGAHPEDYKLPHHAVRAGVLMTSHGGVHAARALVDATAMSDDARAAVKAHLDKHYAEVERGEPAGLAMLEHDAEKGARAAAPNVHPKAIDFPAHDPGTGAGTPTFRSETGNVSQQGEKTSMSHRMSSEHRWATRTLIGHHMRTAEGHMHAMAYSSQPHHTAFHKAAAEHAIGHAATMAGHLRAHMDEAGDDGDADDMRAAKLPEARSVAADSKIGDADLRAKFNEIAKTVHAFDALTTGDIAERSFNVDRHSVRSSDVLDVEIESVKGKAERYATLRAERSAERNDHEAAEREKIVTELQNNTLMTPAQAQRARAEKWTLFKLGEFRARAEKDGPIVPLVRSVAQPAEKKQDGGDNTRSAPAADGSRQSLVGQLVNMPANLQPPPPPTRATETVIGEGGHAAGEVGASLGLDQKRVELRFAKQRAAAAMDFDGVRRITAELAALDKK